jgi:hypothetical protein
MRAGQILPLLLVLLGSGLAPGACSNNGKYQLHWTFSPDGSFAEGDCGKHGVSGIAIAGSSSGGVDNPIAACSPGVFTREVPAGTWTLRLNALDATGRVKEPAPSTILSGEVTVTVSDGSLSQTPAVFLPPQPDCRDGVDNDRDGRVDLDDPGCAGNPEGPSECGDPSIDPGGAIHTCNVGEP